MYIIINLLKVSAVVFIFFTYVNGDTIPNECGYFYSALSTRDPCDSSNGGSITFLGKANVYNNPDNKLATCNVYTPQWVLNQTQTCGSDDCVEEPGYGKSLNINYDHPFTPTSVSNTPTSSSQNEDIHGDVILSDPEYNSVLFKYDGNKVTFRQESGWFSSPSTLKVNTISSAREVIFDNDVDIKIGTITSATYNPPFRLSNSDNNVNNIYINKIDYKEGSNIDLESANSINIESFTVGRGFSNVILKSPNIKINSLTVSNSGSNSANITIIADNIDIGTLDMGQEATVTIKPYTNGNDILMRSNSISASSSSTLILSSGNYYTNSFNIPGTSDSSSVRAFDSNQIVNFYINGDFSPGNNPGINSAGNNGNFGSLPPKNFRLFINGNLNTGGGGTTFNAIIYTEGDSTLGNPTYIKGALSSKNSISIGEGSKIYYSGSSEDEAYMSCPIEMEGDLCYENITTEGFNIFGFGMFYGVTTHIRNISGDTITDATIIKSLDGFNMSAMDKIAIDGVEKTLEKDGDEAEEDSDLHASFGIFNASGIFDKGFVYRISNFDNNQSHEIYDYSMFSFDMSKIKITTIYTKNGKRYYGVINACPVGSVDYISGPFDAWDTFRDSNTTPPTDRNISTKIVNQPFSLSLASLNKENNAYETKMGAGANIQVAIYPKGSVMPISNTITFNANSIAHISSSSNFTVSRAIKDATVGFKLCATYENNITTGDKNYYLYPATQCSGNINPCNAITNGTPTWHICYSSDDFAIRPYAFKVFGENRYKRAGEDFNITIKAVDKSNSLITTGVVFDIYGVNGYNANLNSLQISSKFYQPTTGEISQMQADTGRSNVSTCPYAGTFTINNSFSTFINGEVNATLNFSETGILDLNVSEKQGFEWAKVDVDDTNWSTRQIKPSLISYDENNISANILHLFVPYSFSTTATYNTTNGQNWLYMNDINGSNHTLTTPSMAAYISYNIVAKNKNGNIVRNFTKTCFPDVDEVNAPRVNGLKLNTTFDLFLDSELNISNDANLSFYTEDNNSNAIWTPNKNITLSKGLNSIREWISPFQFENGVGRAKVYFNIDRDKRFPINPMIISVIDANTSTSWMSNPGSPKYFYGNTLNQSKIFYYARIHSPDYSVKGDTARAKIYREIYCKDCNKTIFTSIGDESVDDIYWYINKDENSINDGKIYNFITSSKINHITPSTTVNQGVENDTIKYNAGIYPYKERVEMNASSWFIYNPYDANAITNGFNVEFLGGSGWAGIGNTGKTVDLNISTQSPHRIEW